MINKNLNNFNLKLHIFKRLNNQYNKFYRIYIRFIKEITSICILFLKISSILCVYIYYFWGKIQSLIPHEFFYIFIFHSTMVSIVAMFIFTNVSHYALFPSWGTHGNITLKTCIKYMKWQLKSQKPSGR